MKTYIKCVWANKLTFLGYIFFIGGLILFRYSPLNMETGIDIGFYAIHVGLLLLFGTTFGSETLGAYKRTKRLLNKDKKVPDNKTTYMWYCSRAGIELAQKEHKRLT